MLWRRQQETEEHCDPHQPDRPPFPKPAGIELVEVRTSQEMYQVVTKLLSRSHNLIMAAAVADLVKPQEIGAEEEKMLMSQTWISKTDILAEGIEKIRRVV